MNESPRKMQRNLDGVYFRIKEPDGFYNNVCFSDLTESEQDEIMQNRPEEWLKSLCKILAAALREVGDQFDIACK